MEEYEEMVSVIEDEYEYQYHQQRECLRRNSFIL